MQLPKSHLNDSEHGLWCAREGRIAVFPVAPTVVFHVEQASVGFGSAIERSSTNCVDFTPHNSGVDFQTARPVDPEKSCRAVSKKNPILHDNNCSLEVPGIHVMARSRGLLVKNRAEEELISVGVRHEAVSVQQHG